MATEKRFVSLDEALDATHREVYWTESEAAAFRSFLVKRPKVDAVEVVHGRWEPRKDVPGFVRCSVCRDCNIYDDWSDDKKWNYCPNCGADMRNGDLNEPATSG